MLENLALPTFLSLIYFKKHISGMITRTIYSILFGADCMLARSSFAFRCREHLPISNKICSFHCLDCANRVTLDLFRNVHGE